jgi:hypothetical protein
VAAQSTRTRRTRRYRSLGRIIVIYGKCLLRCSGSRSLAWESLGHRIAIVLNAINLIADVVNTLSGTEPRAIVGVPIAAAILWYHERAIRQL